MTEKRREQLRLNAKNYRNKYPEKVKLYNKNRRPRRFYINLLRIEKGGKCSMCEYDEEIRILHFHHLRDKKFELSTVGKSIEEMREEAEKCILLCPNCHALIHLSK